MVERVRRRGRRGLLWLALVPALLLLMGLGPPAALALPSGAFDHDGASCNSCHGGADIDAACVQSGCHVGFQRDPGATQDCWTCHEPGASMTAFQQQDGCVGACHLFDEVNLTYTVDVTPHGPAPHYASTLKTCLACHNVATGFASPNGSPHHDALVFTAPTAASCPTCHTTPPAPPVDGAPAYHGDLQTGITPTDCAHCHVGMGSSHPTPAQLVQPTIKATWKASGADVIVSGTAKAGAVALAGFHGWVQYKGPADTDWASSREIEITTTATGAFSATVTAPAAGTVFRAVLEGLEFNGKTYRPALASVLQKTSLTIKLVGLKNGALLLGKSLTVKGVVTPARSGMVTVTFQRKVGTKWVAVAAPKKAMDAATGAYSVKYTPKKRGPWRVNAKVAATTEASAALTVWKTFKVK